MKNFFSGLLRTKTPEDRMLRTVRRNVPDIRNILEAGAHNGNDSLRLAKAFPKATVHAFECHPILYKSLGKHVAREEKIKIYETALAPSVGKIQFHISSGSSNASSSILEPLEHKVVHPDVVFEEKIEVDAITIDAWLASSPGMRLDFAWLDMQGAEHAILEASPNALAQLRAIYTEVSFRPMYAGAPLYPEFRNFLEKFGFVLAIEDNRWDDMGNALFLRR